jgi:PhoH-like ATPase
MSSLLNPEIVVTCCKGKTGTGKTLLGLAASIEMSKSFDIIIYAKKVGLLNRDSEYEQLPFYDNLNIIKHKFKPRNQEYQKIEELLKEEKLVFQNVENLQLRSLSNSYLIIDDAHEFTPVEIRKILSRIGEGCKVVILGQNENSTNAFITTGLDYMFEKYFGYDFFSFSKLVKGERSYIAELISKPDNKENKIIKVKNSFDSKVCTDLKKGQPLLPLCKPKQIDER